MKKYSLTVLLIILNLTLVIYLNDKISSLDLRFYHGKDDGFFTRLEATSLMSCLYFGLLSKKRKAIFSLIGFAVGVLSILAAYFTISYFLYLEGFFYHLFAVLIFIFVFHLIDKNNFPNDKCGFAISGLKSKVQNKPLK